MLNTRQTVRVVVAALVLAALPTSGALYAADKSEHDSSKKGGMSGPSMEMHKSMMKGMKEMQA